ncbi:acyl carrier protein [Silvibacterium bohemicum]|jgi:acyl carrier protein|uniref:Acyl carrier protein n=1 Tax=Silvibacterium bohemicum TaxID=1577686 RepID=A0A841K214_9BACT|nr:acyl carrier protein [Silvibacterium bohemicum]MBB6145211.1 acyl carrier protein [Silvibacterium bohemicum]
MDSNAILADMQPIFRDVLDQPDLVVTRESSALTVEDWDSLSHINIVTGVEKKFKVKFTLGELQKLKNVGEMVDLVAEKQQGK